jgi:hypothetical protein
VQDARVPTKSLQESLRSRAAGLGQAAGDVVPLVVFAGAVLLAVAKAARPLADPDTPWHLVVGHRFLDGMSIRHPGPLTHFATEDWRPRDWAVQCLLALFDDRFGLPGVAWLFGAAIIALAVVQLRSCGKRAGSNAALVATGVGLVVGYNAYAPRPQMVSFVLVAVTVGAVLDTEKDLRVRWWLAPLTGAWACLHGLWLLGPALQIVLMLGLWLDRRLTRALAGRLGLLLLLSLVFVAVTPNGSHLATHPLGQTGVGAGYILEYIAPSRASPSFMLWLVVFSIIAVTWMRRSRPSWVHIGLLALASLMALEYLRTIVIGTIILTPLLASALQEWSSVLRAGLSRGKQRLVMYGTAALAGVLLAVVVPHTADAVDDNKFPTAWDTDLDRLPPNSVLINELFDGGYLMWRHPSLWFVGDGNSDQYSAAWLTDWFGALTAQPGWEAFVHRTGADFALLGDTSPLREELEEAGWSVVSSRQHRVLLHRP